LFAGCFLSLSIFGSITDIRSWALDSAPSLRAVSIRSLIAYQFCQALPYSLSSVIHDLNLHRFGVGVGPSLARFGIIAETTFDLTDFVLFAHLV
jgi:hypothetical protein